MIVLIALLFNLTEPATPGAAVALVPPPSAPIDAEATTSLFRALAGQWSCTGAFSSGRPLAADLSFTPGLDGRSLRYSHIDRPPNVYRQESSWGIDKESGELVSLAFAAFPPEPRPAAAMYVAETVTAVGVTFVHQRLLAEPFAPNRFTYTLESPTRMKMLWEVRRGDAWRMGDYLNCDRVSQQS